jgi:hypothetical protein
MAFQSIGLGSVANDGTGDTLRIAGSKINANFAMFLFGAFTLSMAGGATTYTISNVAITTNSKLFLEGQTANARNIYPFLTITKTAGSITITYPNNGNADCTFDSLVFLF